MSDVFGLKKHLVEFVFQKKTVGKNFGELVEPLLKADENVFDVVVRFWNHVPEISVRFEVESVDFVTAVDDACHVMDSVIAEVNPGVTYFKVTVTEGWPK